MRQPAESRVEIMADALNQNSIALIRIERVMALAAKAISASASPRAARVAHC
jgi:polyribonucleotide nucleotidyltransferase